MQAAIDRVMTAYGMSHQLTATQEREIRTRVTAYLSGFSGDDETQLAVEALRYLRIGAMPSRRRLSKVLPIEVS